MSIEQNITNRALYYIIITTGVSCAYGRDFTIVVEVQKHN